MAAELPMPHGQAAPNQATPNQAVPNQDLPSQDAPTQDAPLRNDKTGEEGWRRRLATRASSLLNKPTNRKRNLIVTVRYTLCYIL